MAFGSFWNGFKKGQKDFGDNLATLVNSILLSLVYIVGFGLTFIFAKLFKKNFLELNLERNGKSYWKDLNLSRKPLEEYYRQF